MHRISCVTKAEYRDGYRIHVTFDDSFEEPIDFQRSLKGSVFEPLKDVRYFQQFFLDGWTVAWLNGADIVPVAMNEYDGRT